VERSLTLALGELGPAARARYQSRGPEEHHDHEQRAEDPELVLRDREVVRHAGYVADPLADLVEATEVQPRDEHRARDHAPDVAHAPDDDHNERDHRDLEREADREDAVDERT